MTPRLGLSNWEKEVCVGEMGKTPVEQEWVSGVGGVIRN